MVCYVIEVLSNTCLLQQIIYSAPSGPPTNVMVEALSSSSLHMIWSEPEPESTNGIIREYEVIVRRFQNGSSSLMYSVVDNELIIQLLTPFSDYECSVAAVTVKRGPHSIPVSAQTLQDGNNYDFNHPIIITNLLYQQLLMVLPSMYLLKY